MHADTNIGFIRHPYNIYICLNLGLIRILASYTCNICNILNHIKMSICLCEVLKSIPLAELLMKPSIGKHQTHINIKHTYKHTQGLIYWRFVCVKRKKKTCANLISSTNTHESWLTNQVCIRQIVQNNVGWQKGQSDLESFLPEKASKSEWE